MCSPACLAAAAGRGRAGAGRRGRPDPPGGGPVRAARPGAAAAARCGGRRCGRTRCWSLVAVVVGLLIAVAGVAADRLGAAAGRAEPAAAAVARLAAAAACRPAVAVLALLAVLAGAPPCAGSTAGSEQGESHEDADRRGSATIAYGDGRPGAARRLGDGAAGGDAGGHRHRPAPARPRCSARWPGCCRRSPAGCWSTASRWATGTTRSSLRRGADPAGQRAGRDPHRGGEHLGGDDRHRRHPGRGAPRHRRGAGAGRPGRPRRTS